MKLLERIDQKLSFILSSLVGKNKINPEDVETLEIDRELLLEQFENEREMLENETSKLEETIDNQMMMNLASKIYVISDSIHSGDENYKKETKESIIFDDLDYETLIKSKDEMIEYILLNFEDTTKEDLKITIEELLNV